MFSGLSFSYDGELSRDYGIAILDFEGTGKFNTNILSATVGATKPALSRRFFHAGSKIEAPPQFELTVVSETALDDERRRAILAWLYNRGDFKIFKVFQPDLEGYYYKCVFTDVSAIQINGKYYGFTFTGMFDSPYQYGEPSIVETTLSGTSTSFAVLNESDIPDRFVYPKITLTTNTSNYGIIAIYNSDNVLTATRTMYLNSVAPQETLAIDCELKLIKSNIRTFPMSTFGGQWVKFNKGFNTVGISAPANTTIRVECPEYSLVGF